MRPVTRHFALARRLRTLQTSTAAALFAAVVSGPALAGCPWIVQPSDAIGGDIPDYEIMYNGMADPSWTYYAFTVTDPDLAWELSSGNGLAALDDRSRALSTIEGDDRARFRAHADSIMPLTIYLVVASSSMSELEAIAASIEPTRPIAVGLRMRGASDSSGPLPHRSLPGVELQYASHDASGAEFDADHQDYQLCAYQVLIR